MMNWQTAFAFVGVAAVAGLCAAVAMLTTARICGHSRVAKQNKKLREILERQMIQNAERGLSRSLNRGRIGKIIDGEQDAED